MMDWDYGHQEVHLSMPGYVQKPLKRFQHEKQDKPQYQQAVDGTMLTALSSLAAEQSKPTQRMMVKCKQFSDYAATHEDAVVTYHTNDMVLAIHSDALYLSEPKARS